MTRLLPLLGWLILATAFLTVSMDRTRQSAESIGEREIYYALSSGDELTIHLLAKEQRIRILAHLETPDPGGANEHQSWTYGLQITTERPDEAPVTREHWTRSRRTLLSDVVPGSTLPAMLGVNPGTIVTDSRIIELEPGHLVPHGGTMLIRPLLESPNQRLLLRVFRERDATERERIRLAATPEKRQERMKNTYPFSWPDLSSSERDHVASWARRFGFRADQLDTPVGHLSGGEQARILISRLVRIPADVLLLDEPIAGLTSEEKEETAYRITEIRGRYRTAVLLVEHDLRIASKLADRMIALDYGRKIAQGTPDDVQRTPEVVKAYLGDE